MITTALITVAVAVALIETAALIRERIWEARDARKVADKPADHKPVESSRWDWLVHLT